MLEQLKLIYIFYRQFFIASMLLNFIFLLFDVSLIPCLISKAILIMFIYWIYIQPNRKHQLIFYQNLKISAFKLFLAAFLMDSVLLILLFFIHNLIS